VLLTKYVDQMNHYVISFSFKTAKKYWISAH